MKILCALFLYAASCLTAYALLPATGAGPGANAVAPSYTGPGDIVGGALAWGGLRAYSAATRGTKAVNVCNVADVACADLSTDASTGALVITTIGGSSCSVVVCTIKTLYDQSGTLSCTGSTACDFTNATIANRPVLTVSCINGLPCMTFAGASSQRLDTGGIAPSRAIPYTVSWVAKLTGAIQSAVFDSTNGGQQGFGFNPPNTIYVFAGGFIAGAATDGVFHTSQTVVNAASSDLVVDGVSNTGDAGSDTIGNRFLIGSTAAANFLSGSVVEAGVWPSAFSAGNKTSMNTNQTTFWGPF